MDVQEWGEEQIGRRGLRRNRLFEIARGGEY